MKFLKGLIKIILVLYLLMLGVLYFLQEKLIFLPDKLDQSYRFRTGQEVEVEVAKDIFLNCLMMKTSNAKGVVLYLHGNKGCIRRCISQASMMAGNGYDIFMPDYRGYGKSDGEISSEKQLLADAQKAYDYLKEQYAENQIFVVGYSLGTGMASYLAANNSPKALAMVAPYMSLPDVKNKYLWFTPDFLMKYHFRTDQNLEKIKCPITIFHGTNDNIIPFNSSERLKELKPAQIELNVLNRTSHRGAIFSETFGERMRELLR